MKKIISLLIAAALTAAAALAGCGSANDKSNDTKKHEGYIVDKNNLFGIVEPLWEKGSPDDANNNFQVKGFDLDKTVNLIGALGATSFRMMMTDVTNNPNSIGADRAAYYNGAVAKLKAVGVKQIIGMNMVFPVSTAFIPQDRYSAPRVSDPNYGAWLDAVRGTWKLIARTFPDIKYWEMGNEFNMNTFFHPNGYSSSPGSFLEEGQNGFTRPELTEQNVNYMYYASKGIKEGNPDAVTLMPGYSCGPGGMGTRAVEYFISDIYDLIKSGNYPYGETKSTDPDDYFMALGWHPYVLSGDLDDEWLKANNKVYEVVKKNGDGGKKVFFTEFGFTDGGDEGVEQRQIGFMNKAFEYAKNDMPYLENITAFRLYQCQFAANWGGSGEVYFGYFKEPGGTKGFSPKNKAFALQELYGGTGDLRQYE
jgi:hypothetical protein